MTYKPQQDLNHQTISSTHRYSCHNGDRPKTVHYEMQDGFTSDGKRNMVDVVTEWLPIACGHTWAETDPNCTDCKWRDG